MFGKEVRVVECTRPRTYRPGVFSIHLIYLHFGSTETTHSSRDSQSHRYAPFTATGAVPR